MSKVTAYRFWDHVAINADDTVYMDPKQARALARHIYAACRDIENRSFSTSTVGTVEVEAYKHGEIPR